MYIGHVAACFRVQLDFSRMKLDSRQSKNPNLVTTAFSNMLVNEADDQHQIILKKKKISPAALFEDWVNKLKKKESNKIVLLIDEYDAPFGELALEHPELVDGIVDIFKPFYTMLKSHQADFHKVCRECFW